MFVLGIRGRRSAGKSEFEPRSNSNPLDLIGLFELDETTFRERFRHTPLWRPRRRGLLRNAAIVLGKPADAGGNSSSDSRTQRRRATCARRLCLGTWVNTHKLPRPNALRFRRFDRKRIDTVLREIAAALGDAIDSVEQSGTESTA